MNSGSEYTTSYQDRANDWAQLAQQDPDAFEEMRVELLDEFIKNSPTSIQKRLEGIQWKIDLIRQHADSSAEVLTEISKMMWESTQQLGQKQQDLLNLCTGKETDTISNLESAQILNFRQMTKQ